MALNEAWMDGKKSWGSSIMKKLFVEASINLSIKVIM